MSYADSEISESSQIAYLLQFTSAAGGTCTFSGNFSGSDEDGNYSGSVYSGVGTFTLTPGTAQALRNWRLQHFDTTNPTGDAADQFDFDHDGVPNLVEYALGTSATDASEVERLVQSTVTVAGRDYLALSIVRPRKMSGVNYVVEVSNNLASTWASGSGATVVVEDSPTRLKIRDAKPIGSAQPQRFIRLKVVPE